MSTLDTSELEAHLNRLPPLVDDPGYLVFADWLQAQGDPWGELIVLHHRAAHATSPADAATLEGEAAKLLAGAGAQVLGALDPEIVELRWHLGFVRQARLRSQTHAADVLGDTRTLLALPIARMIEMLVLDPVPRDFETTSDYGQSSQNIVDPWPDWDELGPLLHERLPAIGFGGWPATPATAYLRMPDFDPINRWLRGLQRLELTGSAPSGRTPPDLPQLVELAIRYADASNGDLDVLAAAKLPALERLWVGLGGAGSCVLDEIYPPDDYDEDDPDKDRYPPRFTADDLASLNVTRARITINAAAMRRLLDALPPKVHDLAFRSSALDGAVLQEIGAHPRVATLKRLDLSSCTIGDRDAQILLDTPGFARIPELDLSNNAFTGPVRSRLAALSNAELGEPGPSVPELYMRYVATME